MMRVSTAKVVDVKGYGGMVHETLEEFLEQIHIKIPDVATFERYMKFEARSPRKIDYNSRKSLIQRDIGVAVAANALLIACRLRYSLPEGNANIFHRMMGIDVQIPFCLNTQIDKPVPRHLIQHMVQKRHTGVETRASGTIEIDIYDNASF